ncbi:hypothetical protein [Streptomyces sp. T21Q-yed]|uniref:HD domain-containing protein n=1 Tax=Streptomyces sp. T21Q-yed TaxID=3018441 RepID=UPI0023DED379|nr:hypothetical protein [Streptomyces sp. T21Q-yed]MDF3146134.1 hypothetical protein [Streptomyces sp. T21Q-yed]
MADLDALRARFTRALDATRSPATTPDPAPYADNLLTRWQEPQRHYHTLTHLTAVLDHIDELADHADDPDVVHLAAWFHDAVYLPERSENEERSARLAERALPEAGVPAERTAEVARLVFHDAVYLPERSENEERSARLAERALPEAGVPAERTAEVARLVRLTTTHAPAPDDRDGQVLCDADLAILAAPPSAYAAYTAAVREEYHFVPNDAFREGRAAILRQLLALPSLFSTPYGQEKWEATARYNLSSELEMLSL